MLKNVLAFAAVRDIEDGIRWYKMLLGREPDTKPMTGLAEWEFGICYCNGFTIRTPSIPCPCCISSVRTTD